MQGLCFQLLTKAKLTEPDSAEMPLRVFTLNDALGKIDVYIVSE